MVEIVLHSKSSYSEELKEKISQISAEHKLKYYIEIKEKGFCVVIDGHHKKDEDNFEPIDSLPYKISQEGLKKLAEILYNEDNKTIREE